MPEARRSPHDVAEHYRIDAVEDSRNDIPFSGLLLSPAGHSVRPATSEDPTWPSHCDHPLAGVQILRDRLRFGRRPAPADSLGLSRPLQAVARPDGRAGERFTPSGHRATGQAR